MDVRGLIEELRSLIDSGTRVTGMRNKVLVDVERMSEIGAQLDESMPVSIQEADEIIRQKDSILSQAQLEAQRIRCRLSSQCGSPPSASFRYTSLTSAVAWIV